jgi:hypothetical protein
VNPFPFSGSSLVTSTKKEKKKRERRGERKSLERERVPREESLTLKLPKNPA